MWGPRVRTIFWWERNKIERTTITGALCGKSGHPKEQTTLIGLGAVCHEFSWVRPYHVEDLKVFNYVPRVSFEICDTPPLIRHLWVWNGCSKATFCWSDCAESRVIQCRWIKPREWSLKLKRRKFVLRTQLTSTWSFRSQGMLLSRSRRVSLVCGAYWLLFDSRLLHAPSVDASAGTRGRYYLLKSNGHRISISYKVLSRLQSPLYGNSAKLTDAFVWALWENALRRTQISVKFRERQSLYLVHTDSYPYRMKYVGVMSRWRSESWIILQVRETLTTCWRLLF